MRARVPLLCVGQRLAVRVQARGTRSRITRLHAGDTVGDVSGGDIARRTKGVRGGRATRGASFARSMDHRSMILGRSQRVGATQRNAITLDTCGCTCARPTYVRVCVRTYDSDYRTSRGGMGARASDVIKAIMVIIVGGVLRPWKLPIEVWRGTRARDREHDAICISRHSSCLDSVSRVFDYRHEIIDYRTTATDMP